MTDSEFREKMKELGWDNDYIDEIIQEHNEAKSKGINIPYEGHLIEAPIDGYKPE